MGLHNLSTEYNSMDECDAVIIFHHEWNALKETAKSYRKNYTDGKLMIARDTLPMTHKDRLIEFDPIFLKSYPSSQIFVDLRNNFETLDDVSDEQIMKKFQGDFERISEIIENSTADHIIFLEADSLVQKKVRISKHIDMDSLEANPYPASVLTELKKDTGRILGITGWGFVTGYVSKKCLVGMYQWFNLNMEIVLKYFHLDRRLAHGDYYMPIFAHLAGFEVGNLNQVAECLRDKNSKIKNSALLHQYRKFY